MARCRKRLPKKLLSIGIDLAQPMPSPVLPEACSEEPRVVVLSLAVKKLPIRQ